MIKKTFTQSGGVRPINPVARAMLQKRKSPMVIPNKKKKTQTNQQVKRGISDEI